MKVDFEQLWAIANREAQQANETPENVFWQIGLILEIPIKPRGYYCTPLNVNSFATTGIDGVHFSFLEMCDRALSHSPVVMTVPANFHGQQNVIIGENLFDFLCLGCRSGYSVLEELSWSNGELEPLRSNQYAEHLEQQQIDLLKILTQEFSLEPWSNLEDKIIGLNSTCFSRLEISDEINSGETENYNEPESIGWSFQNILSDET